MICNVLLRRLDKMIAEQMLAGLFLSGPACLTPLPLTGIPQWWTSEQQDDQFYADDNVFRSLPAGSVPTAIIDLS